MYQQTYDPLGNVFLSTIVAAIPILTLLYFIALHRYRDAQGNTHLGISAPWAAFFGVIAAFLVVCLVFRMPVASAVSAFALGTLSGFLGIIWIVLAAMFLYTMSVVTGKFEIVKESIVHISFDRRLQCVLIAFSFGAIIEGTSGFGTPVAIAGAVMVGLGFKPFQSAVLNLLANTAPVAWGAIGTPIVTLAAVSGLDQLTLSSMAGHQLPFVSVLVPFWLVATFVKMEGGTWKEAFEVWPATLCAGLSFALMQFFASGQSRTAPDDRRGLGRLLGDLHRPLPALRLASEDPLPAEVGARGAGQGRQEHRHRDHRQQRMEVPVHRRRDRPCLGALGDPDRLLRALGRAGVQGLPQQPVRQLQVQHHAARLAVRRHAVAAGLGHARRCNNLVQRMPPVAADQRQAGSGASSRSTGCPPPAPACSSPPSCPAWCCS